MALGPIIPFGRIALEAGGREPIVASAPGGPKKDLAGEPPPVLRSTDSRVEQFLANAEIKAKQ